MPIVEKVTQEDKVGIYQIRNILNNKIYIGSTVNLKIRKYNHLSSLKHNKHYNKHLQRAYNKYGKENFVFEIILNCHSSMLLFYEQQFLDQWKPEYNTSIDALAPTRGRKLTKKHKNKISKSLIGHKSYLIKHTEETKKKIKQSMLGKNFSRDHRKNLSKALIGNKNGSNGKGNLGRKLTDEHKRKISLGVKKHYAHN